MNTKYYYNKNVAKKRRETLKTWIYNSQKKIIIKKLLEKCKSEEMISNNKHISQKREEEKKNRKRRTYHVNLLLFLFLSFYFRVTGLLYKFNSYKWKKGFWVKCTPIHYTLKMMWIMLEDLFFLILEFMRVYFFVQRWITKWNVNSKMIFWMMDTIKIIARDHFITALIL